MWWTDEATGGRPRAPRPPLQERSSAASPRLLRPGHRVIGLATGLRRLGFRDGRLLREPLGLALEPVGALLGGLLVLLALPLGGAGLGPLRLLAGRRPRIGLRQVGDRLELGLRRLLPGRSRGAPRRHRPVAALQAEAEAGLLVLAGERAGAQLLGDLVVQGAGPQGGEQRGDERVGARAEVRLGRLGDRLRRRPLGGGGVAEPAGVALCGGLRCRAQRDAGDERVLDHLWVLASHEVQRMGADAGPSQSADFGCALLVTRRLELLRESVARLGELLRRQGVEAIAIHLVDGSEVLGPDADGRSREGTGP